VAVLWVVGQASQGFLALCFGYSDYSLVIFIPTLVVAYLYRHDRRLILTLILWTFGVLLLCGVLTQHVANAGAAPVARHINWQEYWQIYLTCVDEVRNWIHLGAGPYAFFVSPHGNATTTWQWLWDIKNFASSPESRFCWQSDSTFYDGCTFSMYTLLRSLDVLRIWGYIGVLILIGFAHTIVYLIFSYTIAYICAIPLVILTGISCAGLSPCDFSFNAALLGEFAWLFVILLIITMWTVAYVAGSLIGYTIKFLLLYPMMFVSAVVINPIGVGASISSHLARLNRLGLETRHMRGDAPAGFGKWDQKKRGSQRSGPVSTMGLSMRMLRFAGRGLLLVVAALVLAAISVAFAFGVWAFVSTLLGFTTSSYPLCQGSSCHVDPSIQLLWQTFWNSASRIFGLFFHMFSLPEQLHSINGTLVSLRPIV
jgi:hypothetical protein